MIVVETETVILELDHVNVLKDGKGQTVQYLNSNVSVLEMVAVINLLESVSVSKDTPVPIVQLLLKTVHLIVAEMGSVI